jgi:sulfite exporter TauE/SafE
MCGPIAMMLPVSRNNQAKKIMQISIYHLGRISAYSLLGCVFGLLGKGFYLAGIQQQMSIVVGIAMIAFVLIPQNKLGGFNFLKPLYLLVSKLKSALGAQFKNQSFKSLYFIGIFNGFLPCGMVYVALFGALATQNIGLGIIYMALFGVGTTPLMSSIVYVKSFFSQRVRNNIMKYYPIIIVIFGMLFIVRGLGLDIPFLSPATLNLFVQETPNC